MDKLGAFNEKQKNYVSWSTLTVRLAPWNRLSPPPPPPTTSKIFLLTVPRRYFFCGSYVLFMPCVCHAFVSSLLPCDHLLKRAELLVIVCNM